MTLEPPPSSTKQNFGLAGETKQKGAMDDLWACVKIEGPQKDMESPCGFPFQPIPKRAPSKNCTHEFVVQQTKPMTFKDQVGALHGFWANRQQAQLAPAVKASGPCCHGARPASEKLGISTEQQHGN